MIVKERYQIEPRRRDNIRHQRLRDRRKQAADQESQESQSAPTSQPAKRSLRAVRSLDIDWELNKSSQCGAPYRD